MKNPWLRVLGFASRREPLALDSPHDNNGPLLQRGYVAIRCMLRTAMRFRNLSIRWRP
ncbi:MAG: hypothetical protein ACP5I4_08015 [Oceanipulchritudo sp.]